jgi:hypothetical protein
MDTGTKQLLNRWESLRSGAGLARATSVARALWLLGLALFLVVVIGLYCMLPPIVLVAISAVMGWVIAERNALKSRIAQWPTFASYIDWARVSNDLGGK